MSGKTLIKLLLPIMLLSAVLLTACGTASAANPTNTAPASNSVTSSTGVSSSDGTRYRPTWITPVVNGDSVSIPASAITQNRMVHFWVTTASGKESFMAYTLDGVTYIRADICVPDRRGQLRRRDRAFPVQPADRRAESTR